MKILFASAEIYPYAKTGGLADVAQALPRELSKDIDITSIMPLYSSVDRDKFKIYSLNKSLAILLGEYTYNITLYQGFNKGVKTLFVYEASLCDREYLYGDERGDYRDNYMRFGLFSKAIVSIAQEYEMDILHLNDWHTALGALWAKEIYPQLDTIFTIHNLAFQGIFPQSAMSTLGIQTKHYNLDGIEYWDNINYLKAAIAYSDTVTTVSPKYAKEILEPSFGFGLDGFLRHNREKLHGILNGIDTMLFNPTMDPMLTTQYSSYSLVNKRLNKIAFCKERKLEDCDNPLFVFIGRFTKQKCLDLIIDALPSLLEMPLNIAILGEGESSMADSLIALSNKHSNLSVLFGYDESLSHRQYAAADFLLMPSSFEPCGLNQLISLRYGTLPVVNRVGGLYDSVVDIEDSDESICGRGIALNSLDRNGLIEAVERALSLYYKQSSQFIDIIRENMSCDVSFKKSAEKYLKCYRELIVIKSCDSTDVGVKLPTTTTL